MILIIVGKDNPKNDKNGRTYRTVTVEQLGALEIIEDDVLGEITVEGKTLTTRFNAYEESYLDQKPEIGWNQPVFDKANPKGGGALLGAIIQKKVQPYEIPLKDELGVETGEFRTVDTYKTVVFADSRNEELFQLEIEKAFRAAGHELVASKSEENAATANRIPQPTAADVVIGA